MKNKLIITAFLLLLCTLIFAQEKFADRLIQRNGKVIVCQVREVGDDEIKYVMEGYRDGLVFGIDKNKLEKIVFADGREMNLSDSMYGKENYEGQRKNAFKFDFFSPLSSATAFSYERSLRPGRSYELSVGIVGLGVKDESIKDPSGFVASIGYKFIKDPDFYVKGMRYAHILKGAYFKPEFAFATYSFYVSDYVYSGGQYVYSNKRSDFTKGAIILNVGKQWIFSDRFLVDWFVGAGYGLKEADSHRDKDYGFFVGGKDFPIAFNSGFKIGILF